MQRILSRYDRYITSSFNQNKTNIYTNNSIIIPMCFSEEVKKRSSFFLLSFIGSFLFSEVSLIKFSSKEVRPLLYFFKGQF